MRTIRTVAAAAGLFVAISTASTPAQQAPAHAVLEETLKTYAAAWGEADVARRRELLDRIWAPEGTYTDPQSQVRGRDGLSEVIGRFLQQYPGGRIVPTSHPDFHHGMVRFTWKAVDRDGKTIVEGIDFGVVGRDGKLEQIVGFFGPIRPL